MKLFKIVLAMAIISILGLVQAPAFANLSHCGDIITNEVWENTGNVHIINCDVIIASGVTLTIRENTIIKFEIGQELIVNGSLRVLGISSKPVYFTSIRDDTIGGDTNGDGGATTPNWNHWRGIEFRDGSSDVNSLIDNAIIRYAGRDYRGNINLTSASPTIRNTTLSNGHLAIRANLKSLPTLESNNYTDNNYNALSYDGGTIDTDTTWSVTDTTIYIIDDVFVGPGTTLTIQPGVVVKFEIGRDLYIDGALRVPGIIEQKTKYSVLLPLALSNTVITSSHTNLNQLNNFSFTPLKIVASEPVYFTSIMDDTVGGDTNGDGGATTPNWNHWRGIEFRDGSSDANSLIDNAIIRYAGRDYRGNINLTSASPTIRNTTLSDGHLAIRANLESLPTLEGNTYSDNNFNALSYDGGTIDSDTTWSVTDTTIYIINDVFVGTGTTLTIQPGVVIKFEIGRDLYIDGALRALGISSEPVYFTSIRDDTIGGDTNGDGGATTPNWNHWRGIEFRDVSSDSSSLIDNAVIRYAGRDYRGNINLTSASPTIRNTTLSNGHLAIRANLESIPILENNDYSDNTYNALSYDGGTIDSDTTWSVTDATIYIINDVFVGTGTTLTIQPGVVIKFEIGRDLYIDGALRALGISSDPVYFTSIRDDTIGGDTNGDGGATTPNWNHWRGIEFRDGSSDSSSLIDNAVIRYAGRDYRGNINLTSASPAIRNTTLSNGHLAIRANLESLPTLENNDYSDNTYNALSYDGGTIDSDTTWSVTDAAIYIIDDVYVGTSTKLTIQPGVVVKFEIGRDLYVDGALQALGTSSEPLYLTSIRDDKVGGDTNGDGGATTPNWNHWRGIEFRDGSNDASSLIDNAVIRYAGRDYRGSINLISASPTIRNSTLTDSYYGIYSDSSAPNLVCNNIYDNTGYGIYNNTTGVIVQAQNQWWGGASGPYHPITNPTGTGNEVTDGVNYNPWETSLCN